MGLHFLHFVAAAALCARPCVAVADESAGNPFSVMVEARLSKGYNLGAGVIVDVTQRRIRVLTARHVLASDDIEVWIAGRLYPGEVARTIPGRDLAVVDVYPDDNALRPVAAAVAAMPPPGTDLEIWGEDSDGLRLRHGSLVDGRYVVPDEAAPLIDLVCGDCVRGDSGGGVFTHAGGLVGILTARYHRSDGTTVAMVAEPVDPKFFADPP